MKDDQDSHKGSGKGTDTQTRAEARRLETAQEMINSIPPLNAEHIYTMTQTPRIYSGGCRKVVLTEQVRGPLANSGAVPCEFKRVDGDWAYA